MSRNRIQAELEALRNKKIAQEKRTEINSTEQNYDHGRKNKLLKNVIAALIAFVVSYNVSLQYILFDYQQAVVVEAPSVDTSDFMNNTTNITATGKYYTQQEKVNPNDLLYPRFLSLEFRSKPRQFVHIGKAGGSAIRIMVKKSKNKCSELSMQKNIVPDPVEAQVCALSKILSGQVHLKARLEPRKYYDPHTQFLINLRDPIDRLFSWYYYEVVCFQREKRFTVADQPGQASHNFRRLTQECYPEGGFVKIVRDGLLSCPSTRKRAPTPGAVETCDELARLCLRGDIMCFAYNYCAACCQHRRQTKTRTKTTTITTANHRQQTAIITAVCW